MIDWADVIFKILRSRKWTQIQLAARLGVSPTTLNWWIKKGTEPKYSFGVALLKLAQS